MEPIKKGLIVNPKESLLKEIVLVYWSDIMVYYNFLSREILRLLDYYRHLAVKICLQFYELYMQLIELRNKVRNLYKFRSYFDQDQILQEPLLFDVKKAQLKEVERYVSKMQKEQINNTQRLMSKQNSFQINKGNKTDRYLKNQLSLRVEKQRRSNNQSFDQDESFSANSADRQKPFNNDDEDFEGVKKISNNNLHYRIQERLQTMAEQENEDTEIKSPKRQKKPKVLDRRLIQMINEGLPLSHDQEEKNQF